MFLSKITKGYLVSFKRTLFLTPVRKSIIKIQDQNDFNKYVVNSKEPVIVDFFATWCGPCKLLQPRIESVIEELNSTVNLVKVDIDENTEIAMQYGVSVVPELVAIKDGKVLAKIIGLQDEEKLRSFVTKLVDENNPKKETL
ncbi:thioredoxin C-1-like [Daktulosphaira vitifoliae]|uniref:thioredoxin C-1-like n=1 Tax=Daktulosphaira vitifoliae TaxID=58002 RepID=UPI0021AADCB4|nr:thioredoxin C-1-like [Daktulosphaira vitifoliae]